MTERASAPPPEDADLERELRELPVPTADTAFRDRLRAAFVSGEIDRAADTGRIRALPVRRLAAAAAVLLAVGLGLWLVNRGPRLELLAATGEGAIVVDGREIALSDPDAIDAALTPGAEVAVPAGATLDLAVADTMALEIAGGTRMTLPSAYGRWFPSAAAGRVHSGEVRFASGPAFPGRTLRLATPDGIVVVTGTLLSVECGEGGTCVCVLEGVAKVGVDEADLEPVPPGRRKVMPRDGAAAISAIAPPHEAGIRQFAERLRGRFPR
jgi:ferric-dicitrate binding protein FerR (iron transport regulator)